MGTSCRGFPGRLLEFADRHGASDGIGKMIEGTQSRKPAENSLIDSDWSRCMAVAETIKRLRSHKAYLAREYGVTDLAVFGSTVRDAATAASDVDVLVSFDGPATARCYFGVQFYLEDLLGRPVDLVTDKALRAELRPWVESEAVHV